MAAIKKKFLFPDSANCFYTGSVNVHDLRRWLRSHLGTSGGNHLYVISSHYTDRHFNVFSFRVSRGSWDKTKIEPILESVDRII